MDALRRYRECERCGQCCGVDECECWPVEWPERLERFTPEQLEDAFPIIALIGIPAHTGNNKGVVAIDGKEYSFYWRKGGGLSRSPADVLCPFVYWDKPNKQWLCGLVGTSEEWRWEKQCKPYPPYRWSAHSVQMYLEEYNKCSYRWKKVA